MNAFDNARGVEARGMARLVPFLKERAHDGRFVLCNKGPLARHIQEVMGDAFMNSDADRVWSVEIKVEEEDKYGRFFFETWSNLNLDDRHQQATRGSNLGWLYKLRADVLFYYFLKSDDLHIIDFYKLKRWLLHPGEGYNVIGEYRERPQKKRSQANDTWGVCIPFEAVERNVGLKRVRVAQLALFPEPLVAA